MAEKSGSHWVAWADAHARNSDQVSDLAAPFRDNVAAFVEALTVAGASVTVRTTRRSDKRAYLFHWSWMIGLGKCEASQASSMVGVDIQWDHGTEAASRAGASEMIAGFGLAVPPASTNPPSLQSKHISGNAVDMDIRWSGDLRVKTKDGGAVTIRFVPDVNVNTRLHEVGASYGVRKLVTDAPHWSDDGH